MFERYTPEARRAIYFAALEASHRCQTAIAVKDILAGLIRESSISGRVEFLQELSLPLRSRLGIPHLPTSATPYHQIRSIPLDDESKRAVAFAAGESNRDREYWIDCDHLLRALLRFPNAASEALEREGVALEITRAAGRAYRRVNPPRPAPKWKNCLLWLRDPLRLLLPD